MAKKLWLAHKKSDDGQNDWQVKWEGSDTPEKTFSLKAEALEFAVDLAKKNAPSELTIQGQDGKIDDNRSYD